MNNESFIQDCLNEHHNDDLNKFMNNCEDDVQKYAHGKIQNSEEFGHILRYDLKKDIRKELRRKWKFKNDRLDLF